MKRCGTAVTIDPEDFNDEQRMIFDHWLAENGAGFVALQPIYIEDNRVTFDEMCPRGRHDLIRVNEARDDVVTETKTLPITVPLAPYLEEITNLL